MKRRRLGKSGLMVSEIGLGTMTFGSECADKAEAFRIMDTAVEQGVNFFDTAEIYPVPPVKKLAGLTEKIIGEWLENRSRSEIIIASKVAGPAHGWFDPPVRDGNAAIDALHIKKALEGTLSRLKTDYIDLYQVHWPDHGMRIEDTLETLNDLVKEGKVRTIGCSNENAYGLMKALWVADKYNFRAFDTIQNNFSINNRVFENELAEVCEREQVSLLPYSPLAGGVLSGKYNTSNPPQNSRFYKYKHGKTTRQQAIAKRFVNEKTLALTSDILTIAAKYDLQPTTLATAWSKQHSYVASTLIGVSQYDQLQPILDAANLVLPEEALKEINEACKKVPNPMN